MEVVEVNRCYSKLDCGCTWYHRIHSGRIHFCDRHMSLSVDLRFRLMIMRQLKVAYFKENPQWAGLEKAAK